MGERNCQFFAGLTLNYGPRLDNEIHLNAFAKAALCFGVGDHALGTSTPPEIEP